MAKGKRPKKSHAVYRNENRREKNKVRKIAKQLKFQTKKAAKAERRAIRALEATVTVSEEVAQDTV